MTRLRLQRNVQFLYEEHLARVELEALGCVRYERSNDNAWEITAHVNGSTNLIRERAAYIGTVDGQPTVYGQLLLPAYQGGRYNRTRSVNQYLTHWIYPYRGKFHPQMVRALLNILGAEPGSTVLDPFVGSGTTAVEASLLGAHCIGIDRSPICVLLTKVKTQAFEVVDAIRERVGRLLRQRDLHPDNLLLIQEADRRVADFLEAARMVTYSDVARRSREAEAAFRRNLSAMLESVEAHAAAVRDFGLRPGRVTAALGDARKLAGAGVRANSIDVVLTSPPYSIALDYVKNDEHALVALGSDLSALREQMIGVRGHGAHTRLALYNADMRTVFTEIARALRTGGTAAFVIGDATVDGKEVTTTTAMAEWAVAAGLRLERDIPKIVFGLYNVMQDERIVIFRKS